MTVERLDPATTRDAMNRALHLERYAWAAQRVHGGRVLDLACGVGYGAAILADANPDARVLGADRDADAVATATARHGGERVAFVQIDDAAAFDPDERFDTIVSLETIEHLERPLEFLRRAHALLAPGGRLLVSAPVRERPGDNPYHLHCFTADSLRAFVNEGFEVEDCLVQAGGAYLTLSARRREVVSLAWQDPPVDATARTAILLVTWNSAARTLELVQAIRAFTPRPYELVLVDNGSADETPSLLRLLRTEPGVRVLLNDENRRCAAATNQALALARAELAVYLCASHAMVTGPGWLEALVASVDAQPDALIAGDVWPPGFWLPSKRYPPGWSPSAFDGPPCHVQGGAWIGRRQPLLELGMNEWEYPHGGMDVELSYLLTSRGVPLGRCPAVTCPPSPEVPDERPGVLVYHPASDATRAGVRQRIEGVRTLTGGVLDGWRQVNGGSIERLAGDALRVTGDAPDVGVLSTRSFGDVRVRARVEVQGRAIVKLRIASENAAGADGYHVLLGPGTNYLARAGHVLALFPPPPAERCELTFEARGWNLRVWIDGGLVADVRDAALVRPGPVLLGSCGGTATFSGIEVRDLDGSEEAAPLDAAPHDAVAATAPRGEPLAAHAPSQAVRHAPSSPVAARHAAPLDAPSPPVAAWHAAPDAPSRPAAIVFCERLDNESFCESVVRELSAHVDVRPCGPGWPVEHLQDVDPTGARFYLELDAASGAFVRPGGLDRLDLPKFAWLIDTHKKPDFHRQLAREVDVTFYAMRTWGHVLGDDRSRVWLPAHADERYFHPVDAERLWDVVFVGSQPWRAEPLDRLARAHGLRTLVTTTSGPNEKSETAALYARSRLVFNRHVTNDLNFRVFEAMACGRVLLSDAQWNGQYDLLEDERHAVLYKDERDLERQVLRLLADDELRARIERQAAEHARDHHTTRARVAQLARHVETFLRAPLSAPSHERRVVVPTTTPATAREARPRALSPSPEVSPRRWLVLAGDEAPTADLRSYAERLADALAARGHHVTVVRPRRGRFAPRPVGSLQVVEVDSGPLPRARTRENVMLAAAAPYACELERVVREHGPFDAVLAEGPLGQLSGEPVAARLGLPLLLALPSCEVLRRQNRLNREQLYAAELEHWAADRAHAVLTPWPEIEQAARAHYACDRLLLAPALPRSPLPTPAEAKALLAELGVTSPFVLALTDAPRADSTARADGSREVIWSSDQGTFVNDSSRPLGSRRLRGPTLATLIAAAEAVLLGPCDPARADAVAFARRLALVTDLHSVEHALALADRARAPAPPPTTDPAEALERALLLGPSPARREDARVLL